MKYIVVLMISGGVGWLFTLLSIRLALRWGVLDRPVKHKIHSRVTPRFGGIGIASGATVGLAAAALFGVHFDGRMLIFAAGGLAMAGLGAADDVLCLKAVRKLACQVIIAAAVGFATAMIGDHGSMWMAEAAVTALLIVGFSNAVNLIDGMDGLASGVVLIASLAYACIFLGDGGGPALVLSMAVAGACIGFLPHGWHPARTFMGDTGSLFLGYWLAVQMALSFAQSTSPWSYAAAVAIGGVPLADTMLSIARRMLAHRPLFSPDAAHAYNMLAERLHLGHSTTALTFHFAGACFAVVGVLAFRSTGLSAGLSLAALCVLLGLTIHKLRLLQMGD